MKAKLLLPLLLLLHLLVACEPITSSNKEYVEYIVRDHTAILNYALQKCNNVNRNIYYNTFASLCDLSVQDEFAAHIEKASEVSLDVLSESYALAIEDGLCEVPNDPALVPYIGRAFDKLLKDDRYHSLKPAEVVNIVKEFKWGENVYYADEYSFAANISDKQIKISEEHSEYKWVSYDEARNLLKYDSNKSALWELNEKIRRNNNESN